MSQQNGIQIDVTLSVNKLLKITCQFHPPMHIIDASVLTLNKAATAVHQHQPGNFKGVGVYSVSKDLHQDSRDDNKTKGGVGNSLVNRKLTPAHPHMVNHSRPMPFKPPTLQPMIEVDEVPDQHEMSRDVTMSPAAQAHALSLFLSSSTSDSGR